VAYMYDSVGRDMFIGRPEWSRMQGLDADYNNRAKLFEEVYAYALNGGQDEAYMYDSDQADRLEAAFDKSNQLHWAKVYSDVSSSLDYLYYLRGFAEAYASASNAEDDAAGVADETAEWLFTTDW